MTAFVASFVLAFAAGGSIAPDHSREFERGIEAYRRGAWSEAEELWRGALTAELPDEERARLHYALGNAAWRQGATLEAVLRYTAAVRLDPRSSDAWANLELARARAGLEPADRGDLRSTVRRGLGALLTAESRALVLLALLAWVALLGVETFRGGRLLGRLVLAGALVVLLCSLPWAQGWLQRPDGRAWMVVATGETALRSEPVESLEQIGVLAAGEEVERLDSLPGWVKLARADGLSGWVHDTAVLPIHPELADSAE